MNLNGLFNLLANAIVGNEISETLLKRKISIPKIVVTRAKSDGN